ncbi:hypothetical protein C0J52_03903 [Blattella germanica]|nr:hypothetical protein C0J52_03903 [Blattella germanica]PSN52079.1 hypothetical protein C0J52_03903 [Blattella germanica]
MITLSRDLLKDLECPICFNYLTSPIIMCSNGHNIGACCSTKIEECPVCRQRFSPIRNLSLENITQGLKCSCINHNKGCTEVLSLELIKEHEAVCPLGIHECLMNKFPGVHCNWKGSISEFEKHVSQTGSGHVRIKKSSFPSFANCTRERVIFALGEIFLYYKQKQGTKWYFILMLVGTRSQASKFKSVLTFTSPNGIDSIIYTHNIRYFAEDFQCIMNSFNCPQFEEGIMEKFTEGGNIHLTIEVSKIA